MRRLIVSCTVAAALVATSLTTHPHAQASDDDRARGTRILRDVKRELRTWYYDPTFGGRDLDALFASSEAAIARAGSQAEISALIAQAVMGLGDSHTYFIPSPLAYDIDYGFRLQVIGDRCYVTAVKPGSLAAQDGLAPGMGIAAVEGAAASREELWKIEYALNAARPRREVRLHLQVPGTPVKVVRATVGPARPFENFEEWAGALGDKLRTSGRSVWRTATIGEKDELLIVKLATFMASDRQIDEMMARATGKSGLVLDLRGNGGGAVGALARLAGYVLEGRHQIGILQQRKKSEPLRAEPRKAEQRFTGKLVVLIDSRSGSASEVMARTLQLAGRATVIGDRSAGAVMAALRHTYMDGHEGRFVAYGLSITDAKLLMADGSSLEATGVTPDETVLPTAADLSTGRDPVLARAAGLLRVELSAQEAGRLFPREWP